MELVTVEKMRQAQIDAALGRIEDGEPLPDDANLLRAALAANRADVDLWELADKLERIETNLATIRARMIEMRAHLPQLRIALVRSFESVFRDATSRLL